MPTDLTRDLIVAAETGDTKRVRAALAAGADPNVRGPNSFALHCAAFGGHRAIVKQLLDAGADVSLADVQGFTALHLAASRSHPAIVKQLLDAGAPREATTPAGGTPLHVASASGFTEGVVRLLAAGATVDPRDHQQRTPLLEASLAAHPAIVDRLLDAGAAIEARDAEELTPLLAAIMRAQASIGATWSTSGKIGRTKVEYTFEGGRLTMTRGGATRVLPLDEQREVAELDWAPTQLRSYLNSVDIALSLLERGADPQVTRFGNAALHAAARLGEPRLLVPLLARTAADVRNCEGATVVHVAALSKRPEGLALLLERCPALTNARDDFGWTAAHYLCDVGGPAAMFDLLHAAGLDFTTPSTKLRGAALAPGSSPIDVARHWHDDFALAQIVRLTGRGAKAEQSAAKRPASKKPTSKKPAAKKAAAKTPAAKKPAAKKPAAKKSAAKKPAAKKPAAKKPAAKK